MPPKRNRSSSDEPPPPRNVDTRSSKKQKLGAAASSSTSTSANTGSENTDADLPEPALPHPSTTTTDSTSSNEEQVPEDDVTIDHLLSSASSYSRRKRHLNDRRRSRSESPTDPPRSPINRNQRRQLQRTIAKAASSRGAARPNSSRDAARATSSRDAATGSGNRTTVADGDNEEESEKSGLDRSLPPVTTVEGVFMELISKQAREQVNALAENGGFKLRVGTMCSGTDSPIFALDLINKSFIGQDCDHRPLLEIDHVFSVEWVEWKQAFILRNVDTTVFQDVRDFAGDSFEAMTAFGSVEEIPKDVDVLIAGTPCVDFSSLNTLKKRDFGTTEELAALFAKAFPSGDQDEGDEPSETGSKKGKGKAKSKINSKLIEEEIIPKCKDFLENECLKTLKDQSQSSAAFFGMLLYVMKHRPKIVVLENVQKAPWDQMQHVWFPAIGYKSKWMRVDSKDHGTPQTRARTMLIAIREDLDLDAGQVQELLDVASDNVVQFRRRASAPIDKWVLPSNHPFTQLSRQDEEGKFIDKKHREAVSWTLSRKRHTRIRRLYLIANMKPLTQWREGGGTTPHDRLDEIMVNSQPSRVLDCIEIYYLIGRKKGRAFKCPVNKVLKNYLYDILFKTRVIDLSQNVDRNSDGSPFGMCPCITPDGIPFLTNMCRVLNGYEALQIQGLPIHRMVLDLDQDKLRDLAGNAMTTTAIGAVLLGTLTAMDKVCSKYGKKVLNSIPKVRVEPRLDTREMSGEELLEEKHAIKKIAFDYDSDWNKVIEMAKSFRRLCYCNGIAKYSAKTFKECRVCGTIRCTWCAGNPPHDYKEIPAPVNPRLPGEASIEVMRLLPSMITKFIEIPSVDHDQTPHTTVAKILSLVGETLRNAVFYYTGTFITETITACYKADGDLELRAVMSEQGITWNLFFIPASPLGKAMLIDVLDKRMRDWHILEQPFARAVIPPNSKSVIPLSNSWEFWSFAFEEVQLQASKSTVEGTQIGSTKTTVTLQRLDSEPDNYSESARRILGLIEGTYDGHPGCDVAESSLHKCEAGKTFLFKDPFKTLHPSEDRYVVSYSYHLLETQECRENLIRLKYEYESDFMRSDTDLNSIVTGVIEGWWIGTKELGKTPSERAVVMNSNMPEGDLTSGQLWLPPAAAVQQYDKSVTNDENHMADLLSQVDFSLPKTCSQQQILAFIFQKVADKQWYTLPRADYYSLQQVLAPFNAKIAGKLQSSIRPLDRLIHKNCDECFPQKPNVTWITLGTQTKPYQSPDEMKKFKAAYDNGRMSFEVQVWRDQSKSDKTATKDDVKVRYLYRPDVLIHRALAHLPPVKATTNVDEIVTKLNAHVQACVAVNLKYTYRPFRRSIIEIPHTTSPDEDPRFITPEGKDLGSLRSPDGFNGTLSPYQSDLLRSQLEMEYSPKPFSERETAEEFASHIGVRFLGEVLRFIKCRGGVCTAAVGFGKTVVILTLIWIQREFDRKWSAFERSKRMGPRWHVHATLVIAPEHLVDQWVQEAEYFLGGNENKDKYLPIYDYEHLQKYSYMDFLDADIVIVSNKLFSSEKYLRELAKYGGHGLNPDVKDHPTANRRFREWMSDSLDVLNERTETHFKHRFSGKHGEELTAEFAKHIEMMKKEDAERREEHEAKQTEAREFEERQARWMPTADYEDGVNDKRKPKQRAPLDVEFDPDKLFYKDFVLLEYISWARAIQDEFSYRDPTTELFMRNVSAFVKYVLSATPLTRNLATIANTAKLIGVHVVRPLNQRLGLPQITVGPTPDGDTNAEQVLAQGKHQSDRYIQERQDQGHAFLKHFSSFCPYDVNYFGTVTFSEVVVVNGMMTQETTAYFNGQNILQSVDLDADMVAAGQTEFLPHVENRGDMNGHALAGQMLILLASCTWKGAGNLDNLKTSSIAELSRAKRNLKLFFEKSVFLHRFVLALCYNTSKEKKDIKTKDALGDSRALVEDLVEAAVSRFGGYDEWREVLTAIFRKLHPENLEALQKSLKGRDGKLLDDKPLFDELHRNSSVAWTRFYRIDPSIIPKMRTEELEFLLRDLITEDHFNNTGKLKADLEGTRILGEVLDDFEEEDEEYEDRIRAAENDKEEFDRLKALTKTILALQCESKGIKVNTLAKKDQMVKMLIKDLHGVLPPEHRVEGRYSDFMKTDYPDLLQKITKRNSTLSKPLDAFVTNSNSLEAAIAHTALCLKQVNLVDVLEHSVHACRVCGDNNNDLYLVCECGHVLCRKHFEGREQCGHSLDEEFGTRDPSKCPSLLRDRAILLSRLSSWARPQPTRRSRNSTKKPCSSKTDMIMKTINGIGKGEGVVLFVQYEQQKRDLIDGLKNEGIPYTLTTRDVPIREVKDTDPKCEFKVLLLTLENSEAAGTNLQFFANHVMFASPLCTDLQEHYDGTMEQAKGRCLRFGQKKDVKIYHFVTANTVEVDMLELRRKQHVLVVPGQALGRFGPTRDFNLESDIALPVDEEEQMKYTRTVASTEPVSVRPNEERVNSILSAKEVWKTMNERNWLKTIGIER